MPSCWQISSTSSNCFFKNSVVSASRNSSNLKRKGIPFGVTNETARVWSPRGFFQLSNAMDCGNKNIVFLFLTLCIIPHIWLVLEWPGPKSGLLGAFHCGICQKNIAMELQNLAWGKPKEEGDIQPRWRTSMPGKRCEMQAVERCFTVSKKVPYCARFLAHT